MRTFEQELKNCLAIVNACNVVVIFNYGFGEVRYHGKSNNNKCLPRVSHSSCEWFFFCPFAYPVSMIAPLPTATRIFLLTGAGALLLAVILGAFGAHALRDVLPADLRVIYQTASQYHFYHALGLLLVGVLGLHWPTSACLRWAGWLLIIGMVLFSGSLYVLSLTGLRWLGAVTPFGGVAFIAAWALVMLGVARQTRSSHGDGQ